MRSSLTISCVAHATVLAWGLVTFGAKPFDVPPSQSLPVDIISETQFSQLTAGQMNAKPAEKPKPLVEKIAEPKPAEQPVAKVTEKKEVTAAREAEPPPPPPKSEPKPAESAKKEPKVDPIAEALKKDEAKQKQEKPEQKVEKPAPVPPKKPVQQPPKFDPTKVAALLDKRDPMRHAAAGQTMNSTASLGVARGTAATISQTELDALRARLMQLWNPPAGIKNPEEMIVRVRIQLSQDGRVVGQPQVVSSGSGFTYATARDSAVRAIFRGQPFTMLNPANYDTWKDVEITFDPRDMIRG
jgi:colicin import membrane protein